MCGICGIASVRGASPPDPELVRRMIGRLRHRGPDGGGYYRDRMVALGHSRLAIVDVAGGAQPLSNEDGTVWLTYNGEIYNYLELTNQLQSLGHRFRTHCDSEVIVHAFEEWGTDCFAHFNGQWAIVLWDSVARRLVLSRDRMGIRPLYYTVSGNRLLFASEIKALLADPTVTRRPDPIGFEETFTFWSPVAERTMFEDILQLRPAHYAVVDMDRSLHPGAPLPSEPYWELQFPPSHINEEATTAAQSSEAEYADQLRSHLVDAARLRFTRSDVPVGAFISGGLDSSVTTAVLAAHTRVPLTTFAIRFEDKEFDESHYQSLMAERLGTDHRSVVVSHRQIGEVFPDVVRHAERPILRSAPAPLYLLSKLVHDAGYKVVVTGEGADEVLGGYDLFREAKVREFLSRDPDSKRRAKILSNLYPWMVRSPTNTPGFARAFFTRDLAAGDAALSHRPRWGAAGALTRLLSRDLREQIDGQDVIQRVLSRLPAEHGRWDSLARAQWLEITTLLQSYILSSQGDRMLNAHSVEGRFPFLDHRVVEFANQLPPRYKLMGLDEKHLLKTVARGIVPDEIIERPKQPYRAPDAGSFVGEAQPEWVRELLCESSIRKAGLFDPVVAMKVMEKADRRGGRGMSNTDNMRVLALTSGMLWHSIYIEDDGGEGTSDPSVDLVAVVDRVADPAGGGKETGGGKEK